MSETPPQPGSSELEETVRAGYTFEGPALELGGLMLDAEHLA